MQVRVTAYSQSHRLRERLAEAEVSHGQELRADVRAVRVQGSSRGWFARQTEASGEVFFCAMRPVVVRRVSIAGDGGMLPEQAALEGLRVPAEGTYDLMNVLIRSNGDLRIICDEASRVEAAGRPTL